MEEKKAVIYLAEEMPWPFLILILDTTCPWPLNGGGPGLDNSGSVVVPQAVHIQSWSEQTSVPQYGLTEGVHFHVAHRMGPRAPGARDTSE